MKTVNIQASSRSSPNACTDCTTPERVMNVPKIVRKNVTMTSETFQTFSMPRRSCTITECRNAVAGEPRQQAGVLDRIPAPVAAPAQFLVRPERAEREADRQKQPRHHRPARGPRAASESSSWPVASAAMPNANGIVMPTKPRYSIGGWIAM